MRPATRAEYDAVVVGAGPAGSAAATTLAQHGRRVLLLEKAAFPRHKVCGAFLAGDAASLLGSLGAEKAVAALEPEIISRGSIHLPGGRRVEFPLRRPALGLSRFALDDLLARRAREAGADARFEARVLSALREGDLFRVQLAAQGGAEEVFARAVVGAWGRWDALDRALDRGFTRRRRRFFGWSRDFRGEGANLAGRVHLYLFRGGYCGLSRVEGGAINLAGVVSERSWASDGGGWEGVLARARNESPALDADLSRLDPGPIGFLGTGPVFFTSKPPVEKGVLMAGDAAGVLDPFSGEGQRAALAAGILAGETIESALSGATRWQDLSSDYEREWKRRFARRFFWSTLFRALMLHPIAADIAARVAGKAIVRLAMRSSLPAAG